MDKEPWRDKHGAKVYDCGSHQKYEFGGKMYLKEEYEEMINSLNSPSSGFKIGDTVILKMPKNKEFVGNAHFGISKSNWKENANRVYTITSVNTASVKLCSYTASVKLCSYDDYKSEIPYYWPKTHLILIKRPAKIKVKPKISEDSLKIKVKSKESMPNNEHACFSSSGKYYSACHDSPQYFLPTKDLKDIKEEIVKIRSELKRKDEDIARLKTTNTFVQVSLDSFQSQLNHRNNISTEEKIDGLKARAMDTISDVEALLEDMDGAELLTQAEAIKTAILLENKKRIVECGNDIRRRLQNIQRLNKKENENMCGSKANYILWGIILSGVLITVFMAAC